MTGFNSIAWVLENQYTLGGNMTYDTSLESLCALFLESGNKLAKSSFIVKMMQKNVQK